MTIQYHVVADGETLTAIARQHGLTPRQLRSLNRLRSSCLFAGQHLIVKVLAEEAANSRGGMKTYEHPSGSTFHQVKAGDTLFSIARKYNTSVARIKADNQLSSDALSIGQMLRIGQNAPQQTVVPQENLQYHTVQRGDTLYSIARRYGTTVDALQRLNKLTGNAISLGMRLVVTVQQSGGSFNPGSKPEVSGGGSANSGGSVGNITGGSVIQGNNGLTLRVPLLDGNTITANLKNFKTGYLYHGQSHQIPSINEIRQIGLDDSTFNALQYCKKVEGNYDAINTYDSGIFSFGFIQFIGKDGVLDKLLRNIKAFHLQKFVQVFERAGIYLSNDRLMIYDERRNPLIAENAWYNLRTRPEYFIPFIQAGFDRQMILEQYRLANMEYATPALTRTLQIRLPNGNVQGIPAGEVFQGLEARSLLVAMGINLGLGGMSASLSESLSDLAFRNNIWDARQLSRLGWQAILSHIAQYEQNQIAMGNNAGKRNLTLERVSGILTHGIRPVV
jgi:LysM repeat protein